MMTTRRQTQLIIRSSLALASALAICSPGHARSADPAGEMTTAAMEPSSRAQMNPYFSAINYALPGDTLMLMLLPDLQIARTGRNFVTGMVMAQYGLADRLTVGLMVEGQKVLGLPAAYGGMRFNAYFHVFPDDRLLNLTLYGEYEGLNGAALYKMEVAGFGGEDLVGSLREARRTPARTFEQRAIVYHDWGRFNVTFNLIGELGFDSHEYDFGYSWGVFWQPSWMGMDAGETMAGMAGAEERSAPPALSSRRLGVGLEVMGALGNTHELGVDWSRQQHYAGPVLSYVLSRNWSLRFESEVGLSPVSDPLVLRMGVAWSSDRVAHRVARAF